SRANTRSQPPSRRTRQPAGWEPQFSRAFPAQPAAGVSATLTALDGGDGASAGEEPDAGDGGWAAGELPSCATAIDPELAGTPRGDSVSRFSRFRSARISDAT